MIGIVRPRAVRHRPAARRHPPLRRRWPRRCVLVDAVVLGVTSALLGDRLAARDAAVVALLLVTAVYGPLRHRLWLLVRRLVLGQRDDPYRVVAGLAERLEQLRRPGRAAAGGGRARWPRRSGRRTSGSRWTRPAAALVAEHGTGRPRCSTLPITYRGEEVGRLLLPAQRTAGRAERPGRAAARRRGPAGGGRGAHRAAGRGAAAQPRAARQRPRGGTPPAAPRPARRARAGAGRGGAAHRHRPQPGRPGARPTPTSCSSRPATTSPTRWPTCAGWCTTCARRRWTTSGCSARSGSRPSGCARPGSTVTGGRRGRPRRPAGGGRGGRLPDRLRGAGQRRAARPGRARAGRARASPAARWWSRVRDDGVGIAAGTPAGVGPGVARANGPPSWAADCRIECPDERRHGGPRAPAADPGGG